MANECIPYYEPGANITGVNVNAGALTGKRFCRINGDREAGGPAGISDTALGGNVKIDIPTAAGRVFGVIERDCPIGGRVGVVRGPGKVVPVTAGGAIAAFAEVEVDAAGKVVTKAAGVAVGYVLSAAVNNGDAQVSLYA